MRDSSFIHTSGVPSYTTVISRRIDSIPIPLPPTTNHLYQASKDVCFAPSEIYPSIFDIPVKNHQRANSLCSQSSIPSPQQYLSSNLPSRTTASQMIDSIPQFQTTPAYDSCYVSMQKQVWNDQASPNSISPAQSTFEKSRSNFHSVGSPNTTTTTTTAFSQILNQTTNNAQLKYSTVSQTSVPLSAIGQGLQDFNAYSTKSTSAQQNYIDFEKIIQNEKNILHRRKQSEGSNLYANQSHLNNLNYSSVHNRKSSLYNLPSLWPTNENQSTANGLTFAALKANQNISNLNYSSSSMVNSQAMTDSSISQALLYPTNFIHTPSLIEKKVYLSEKENNPNIDKPLLYTSQAKQSSALDLFKATILSDIESISQRIVNEIVYEGRPQANAHASQDQVQGSAPKTRFSFAGSQHEMGVDSYHSLKSVSGQITEKERTFADSSIAECTKAGPAELNHTTTTIFSSPEQNEKRACAAKVPFIPRNRFVPPSPELSKQFLTNRDSSSDSLMGSSTNPMKEVDSVSYTSQASLKNWKSTARQDHSSHFTSIDIMHAYASSPIIFSSSSQKKESSAQQYNISSNSPASSHHSHKNYGKETPCFEGSNERQRLAVTIPTSVSTTPFHLPDYPQSLTTLANQTSLHHNNLYCSHKDDDDVILSSEPSSESPKKVSFTINPCGEEADDEHLRNYFNGYIATTHDHSRNHLSQIDLTSSSAASSTISLKQQPTQEKAQHKISQEDSPVLFASPEIEETTKQPADVFVYQTVPSIYTVSHFDSCKSETKAVLFQPPNPLLFSNPSLHLLFDAPSKEAFRTDPSQLPSQNQPTQSSIMNVTLTTPRIVIKQQQPKPIIEAQSIPQFNTIPSLQQKKQDDELVSQQYKPSLSRDFERRRESVRFSTYLKQHHNEEKKNELTSPYQYYESTLSQTNSANPSYIASPINDKSIRSPHFNPANSHFRNYADVVRSRTPPLTQSNYSPLITHPTRQDCSQITQPTRLFADQPSYNRFLFSDNETATQTKLISATTQRNPNEDEHSLNKSQSLAPNSQILSSVNLLNSHSSHPIQNENTTLVVVNVSTNKSNTLSKTILKKSLIGTSQTSIKQTDDQQAFVKKSISFNPNIEEVYKFESESNQRRIPLRSRSPISNVLQKQPFFNPMKKFPMISSNSSTFIGSTRRGSLTNEQSNENGNLSMNYSSANSSIQNKPRQQASMCNELD